MTDNNLLLLYAHPAQHRSQVNQKMFECACAIDGVTAIDLYREYPRFNIDINLEQSRLLTHSTVIFQFPFYWYSTPSILKEWMDLVLEFNFAYGPEGNALNGKTLLCALSAGGNKEAYQRGGHNQFTINELLRPIEQTANLTGMDYLPPFVLYSSRSAVSEDRLERHLLHWRSLLTSLVDQTVDMSQVKNFPTINTLFENSDKMTENS